MIHFNWTSPDYTAVFAARAERLKWIRANPEVLPALFAHYAEHPDDFINDWGMTYDPRNAEIGLPTALPFVLFDKQREWVRWAMDRWRNREPGVTEKSRDTGVSWLALSTAATLCNFRRGLVIGFGSRKEDYVDRVGDPKSLFWKARFFMSRLPVEFRRGWDERRHSSHLKIRFPATESVLTGEAGDSIGRGDRTSIYFVDEAAHLERPKRIEASLSATTNCRLDISSANGTDNPFYDKVSGGRVKKFTLHWRDDPRKDQAWYDKQRDLLDEITVAQEIDINYSASKSGILIPSEWVQSAVGADRVLGLRVTGERWGALDVADEGPDLNAFCYGVGVLIEGVRTWSGKGADIYATVDEAFTICDEHGLGRFLYDADGLGAGVRGDARVLNEKRRPPIKVQPFRGSGAVIDPERPVPVPFAAPAERGAHTRRNEDFFVNAKAQAWWNLRVRFQRTHRAVLAHKAGQPIPFATDDMIFISASAPDLGAMTTELSQPTYEKNGAGKILVDKAPEGARSPNRGDAVMIRMAPIKRHWLDQ